MNVLATHLDLRFTRQAFGFGAGRMSKANDPLAAEFDRCVLAVAASSDREAFAELYGHFAPRVKGYLARLGAPLNLAEDLAQETMITVWRKAAMFDPSRASASTWIFTIARNLRIDRFRREKAADTFELDPSEAQDHPPGADITMIADERDERIHSALGSLSAEQLTIVQLAFFEDRPHSEISRTLGLPLGTVKSRVRLALGHLRTLLADLQ